MKRTQLQRRTPLRQSRPRHLKAVNDPARDAWKTPIGGVCACGCGQWAPRLERHHVLLEQIVRRENGDLWSMANSMLLHPVCHRNHHAAARKIPFDRVPVAAIEFAVELLGVDRAREYFTRRYDTSSSQPVEAA